MQDVDCREPAALRDLTRENDLSVQQAAQNIRNRFVHIGAGDKHGENRRDIARAIDPRPGPFAQPCQQWRDRRRKAPHRWRFVCGGGDLPVRFCQTGNGIDHEQDMAALIPEMFRDRHRGERRPAPRQGRLVRCGSHYDRPRHSGRAKDMPHEGTDLTPALSNKGDDADIGLQPRCKRAQKVRLADARAREKPQPLTPHDREKGIHGTQSGREARPKPAPAPGRRRCRVYMSWLLARGEGPVVQRPAARIDKAPYPTVVRRKLEGPRMKHGVTDRQAGRRPFHDDDGRARVDCDDFTGQRPDRSEELDLVSEGKGPAEPLKHDMIAPNRRYPRNRANPGRPPQKRCDPGQSFQGDLQSGKFVRP